jgi:hypothetical protein
MPIIVFRITDNVSMFFQAIYINYFSINVFCESSSQLQDEISHTNFRKEKLNFLFNTYIRKHQLREPKCKTKNVYIYLFTTKKAL